MPPARPALRGQRHGRFARCSTIATKECGPGSMRQRGVSPVVYVPRAPHAKAAAWRGDDRSAHTHGGAGAARARAWVETSVEAVGWDMEPSMLCAFPVAACTVTRLDPCRPRSAGGYAAASGHVGSVFRL
jgi:hypothetical protein